MDGRVKAGTSSTLRATWSGLPASTQSDPGGLDTNDCHPNPTEHPLQNSRMPQEYSSARPRVRTVDCFSTGSWGVSGRGKLYTACPKRLQREFLTKTPSTERTTSMIHFSLQSSAAENVIPYAEFLFASMHQFAWGTLQWCLATSTGSFLPQLRSAITLHG